MWLFVLPYYNVLRKKKKNPSGTGASRGSALCLSRCTAPRPGTRRYREAAAPTAAPRGEPAPLSGKAEPGVTTLRGQINSVSLRRAAEAVASAAEEPAALGAGGPQRGKAAPQGEAVGGGGALGPAPRARGAFGRAPVASRRCGELRPAAAILRAALPPRLSDRSLPSAAPPPREAAGPGRASPAAGGGLGPWSGPGLREVLSSALCPHTGAYQALSR